MELNKSITKLKFAQIGDKYHTYSTLIVDQLIFALLLRTPN